MKSTSADALGAPAHSASSVIDRQKKAIIRWVLAASAAILGAGSATASCNSACLEGIAASYRTAYLAHEPARAPFSKNVRFTENSVEMALPDGTWDTVTREVGPALTVSDPVTGNVGVFTSIMQNETPGFLALRLRVRGGKIVEVEHVVATQRNISLAKMGDVASFTHDPDFARAVVPDERMSRADLIQLANGYFATLENNTGTIHGRYSPTADRWGNGVKFPGIQKFFENGVFRFNDRVRDRDFFLVDEARGVVMARADIDHKGRLDHYTLTDGTAGRSPYREPQSLAAVELFKIKKGEITAMETIYVQTPYFMRSPWSKRPDRRAGGIRPPPPPPPASTPAPTNPPLGVIVR